MSAGALAVAARRDFVGALVGIAVRPGGGQGRLALAAAGGTSGRRAGVRAEATAQFVVNPAARSGVTLYGALGLAWMGVRASPGAGYVIGLVGLERAAGRPRGWYVELGLGGGARLAAGWRWRRVPPWW